MIFQLPPPTEPEIRTLPEMPLEVQVMRWTVYFCQETPAAGEVMVIDGGGGVNVGVGVGVRGGVGVGVGVSV